MYFFFEVYYAFSIPKLVFLQRENSRYAAHETEAKPNAAKPAGGRRYAPAAVERRCKC